MFISVSCVDMWIVYEYRSDGCLAAFPMIHSCSKLLSPGLSSSLRRKGPFDVLIKCFLKPSTRGFMRFEMRNFGWSNWEPHSTVHSWGCRCTTCCNSPKNDAGYRLIDRKQAQDVCIQYYYYYIYWRICLFISSEAWNLCFECKLTR